MVRSKSTLQKNPDHQKPVLSETIKEIRINSMQYYSTDEPLIVLPLNYPTRPIFLPILERPSYIHTVKQPSTL